MSVMCLHCGNRNPDEFSFPIRARTILNDGYSLSIQANSSAYCSPRQNFADHYDLVEVGYVADANNSPVTPPESWREYGDSYDENGNSQFPSNIYAYIPIALVEEFIAQHGGRKYFL